MKKLNGIIAIVFCCLFLFPVQSQAQSKSMVLDKEYTVKEDCDDTDEIWYTLKIKEAGKYKVTISFDECYKSYYDDTPVHNYDTKMRFMVSSGKNEYKCEVPFEEEKTFVVGLDKGNSYIYTNEPHGEKYKISTIKVEKYPTKNYSFSQAYQFAKKNKKPGMEISKNSSIIRILSNGFIDTDIHERDGFSMAYGVSPYIDIVKQGKSSYATYNLLNFMSIYSIPYIEDSDLEEIMIYNKNDKIVYMLDSCKETNKYDYVDYIYKDESICECVLFTSYTNSTSDVNKLINIIKEDGSKIKIKGEGSAAAYYIIKFDKTSKKQMLDSLRLYKELLKQYK